MAASCRKAAQARLWSDLFKNPSHWKDNRTTKTSSRAPDFTHRLTNQCLWMDSWSNPSWIHHKLKLQDAIQTNGDKAGLDEDGARTSSNTHCNNKVSSNLDAQEAHYGMLGLNWNAVQTHGTILSSKRIITPTCGDVPCTTCWHAMLTPADRPSLNPDARQRLSSLYQDTQTACSITISSKQDAAQNMLNSFQDSNPMLSLHATETCIDPLRFGISQPPTSRDSSFGNSLVLALVDVGKIDLVRQVFDGLESRYECTRNARITGYVKHKKFQHSLDLYQKMQEDYTLHPSANTSVALLKSCTMLKDIENGLWILDDVDRVLVDVDLFFGSSLIKMFAKCGHLAKAREVCNKLGVRDIVVWNALISGYIAHGCSEEVLDCYKQMYYTGIPPDGATLVCISKVYGSLGDTNKGREIHIETIKKGYLEKDVFVGSSLIDMYAKFGLLVEAQEVFDKLLIRNTVSWNALIAGYAEHGYGEKALNCFDQMQHGILSPDAVTFMCSLKACALIAAGVKAQEIHAELVTKGLLDSDIFLCSILVDVYAKCGLLADAQSVFWFFPVRDVILWNVFISGFVEHGLGEEAIKYFDQMQDEGVSSTVGTLVCSLKACVNTGAIVKGREIHAEIIKRGSLEEDAFLGSILVDLYCKLGLHTEAQKVFEKLPVRDIVLWNALIAGYAEHRLGEAALKCLKIMVLEGIVPDAITFTCILKACSSIGAIVEGRELHIEIIKKGLLETEVGNALIDMYSKCCALAEAQEVFHQLPVRSVVSLNTLISGCVDHGQGGIALDCLQQTKQEHISSDAVTLACSLKACGAMGCIAEGQEVHHDILINGFEQELLVGNTLVDFYAKCGLLVEAVEIFNKLQSQDTVSWTALITGCAEHGHGEEALHYFEQMQDSGIPWDAITLVCCLTACGNTRSAIKGGELHVGAVRRGLLDTEHCVCSTLVDMYAKCGSLVEAQKVFDSFPARDVISCNALLAGYVEHGCSEVALYWFEQMQHEDISRCAYSLVCGLKACGNIGATEKGEEIHSEIVKKGFDKEILMGNTLIDMYAKCGVLAAAQAAFDRLIVRDLVSWNTLIAGYAQRGESQNVFLNFEKMKGEGVVPDLVTFSSVLNACSHTGGVDKGQMYFEAISIESGVIPTIEHYTCLVDLLGRAGQVDKVATLIDKMPFQPGIVAWRSALGACRKWGNVELGKCIFENVVGLDERDAATYVCMCNIYADAAMQEVSRNDLW